MSLYILLGTLTETGQRRVRDNPDHPIEAIKECEVDGAEVLGQYAVLGKYDFVLMVQAEDNEAVARLSLEVGVNIGLHIETLPAMAIGVLGEHEDEWRIAETETSTRPGGEAR